MRERAISLTRAWWIRPSAMSWLWGLLLTTTIIAQTAPAGRLEIRDALGKTVGAYRSSHALLIGVSDYTAGWPDLESIPGELEVLREALEAQGFEVESVLDPNENALRRAFEDFIDHHGYDRDRRLLFFFAGHGHTRKDGDKGYLVPADAPDPRRDEKGFLRRSLEMEEILTWARRMEAHHALFLFDSCFSGTIFKARDLPEIPLHISDLTARPVRQLITAGSAGEVVPAKSIFVPTLVRALDGEADRNGDGFVTGTELGVFLHEHIVGYAAGQTPQYGKIRDPDLDAGDFVFQAPRSVLPADPTVLVRPLERESSEPAHEIELWRAVGESSDPAELQVYLRRYPQGTFAELARLRVAKLEAGEPPATPRRPPHVELAEPRRVASTVGHREEVRSLAWSPDGQILATASFDDTVRLWDPATGRELAQLEHPVAAEAIAWSSDGRLLASAGGDRTVRIWDVVKRREIDRFENHSSWVLSLAWAADAQMLAAGTDDGFVVLHDLATGRSARHRAHMDRVRSLAWSPARQLVSGSIDGQVNVWSHDSSAFEKTAKFMWLSDLAWSPSGDRLAVSADGQIHVGAPAPGMRPITPGPKEAGITVRPIAWSPDGRYIAFGNQKAVQIQDAEQGITIRQFHLDFKIHVLGWSSEGDVLGIGGNRSVELKKPAKDDNEDSPPSTSKKKTTKRVTGAVEIWRMTANQH